MAKLIMMCGIPGSGKSTWLHKNITENNQIIVSRDAIRFSKVKEDEEYFLKEKEIYKEFVNQINYYLAAGLEVYADATHINPPSRAKLLNQIEVSCEKEVVVMNTPLCVCFTQNDNRKGTRSFVPRGVIRRMNEQMILPTLEEGFDNIKYVFWKEEAKE